MEKTFTRPKWEVADVLRRFGGSYQSARSLPLSQLRVIKNIVNCRTAVLGGHMEECDSCAYRRPVYNSCRDRHCPKCQTLAKEKWLAARKTDFLPVEYFHSVFTLPHELNALTLANKRVTLNILFRAVSETLLQFGRDKRSRLEGTVGFTLILHTWNQRLLDHFHLHCVIPAGALSFDGKSWKSPKQKGFLFSVAALANVFAGKFLEFLKEAFDAGKIEFSGQLAPLSEAVNFLDFIAQLASLSWVVYSKPSFGGPERVLSYLGRYTHKVAISNHRLLEVDEESVSFAYRDRGDGNKTKVEKVAGEEFIRRFLLHTLPNGFMRIRHYGFLASRNKTEALACARQALDAKEPIRSPEKNAVELLSELTGIDILCCPTCKIGRMREINRFEASKFPAVISLTIQPDSS